MLETGIKLRDFLKLLAQTTAGVAVAKTSSAAEQEHHQKEYGSMQKLADGDILVTLSNAQVQAADPAIREIFRNATARIWEQHASFQDLKLGKAKEGSDGLIVISTNLNDQDFRKALTYRPGNRAIDLANVATNLNFALSTSEQVFAIAKECGMNDLVSLNNHQRLSIHYDDAKYWLNFKPKLNAAELAARFIARRIVIELAVAFGVEIKDQGSLSELVGSSRTNLEKLLADQVITLHN